MKFFALSAIVATVSAGVGQTCVTTNPVACTEGVECCGNATPEVSGSGTAQTICQTKTETKWEDASNNVFTFACVPYSAEHARQLAVSVMAIVGASLMMA